MEYNVELVAHTRIKGIASFINNSSIQVIDDGKNVITYHSIQLFADNWRFIEDKPKELLKPCVITFIKHYLILNDIKLDQVECIKFINYYNYCECDINGSFDSIADQFELKKGLIKYSMFEGVNEKIIPKKFKSCLIY